MTAPARDDEHLTAALRRELLSCAAAGATVTYGELADRSAFPGPQAIHRLTGLLEAMIREDHAAGRPLLAALAVSRAQRDAQGRGIPGRGFFQLLSELGRYAGPDQGPQAAAHHAEELQEALAHWGKPSSSVVR